ncbi:MAG: serpin family protein [Eubacteriales bacterium]|nr:serpin family protein [Eubacteriales bacterium]
MKKRILAIALMVGMLLPAAGAAQAESDPAAVRTLSRAGFVQLLARSSGEDFASYQGEETPFADAEDDAAVTWAYHKWLVNGDERSLFRPDDAITRQEAAAILGRYLDYKYTALPGGCGTGAPSMDNVASWAREGAMKCWMYGVIPTDGTDFNPLSRMTGAHGALMIDNANSLTMSAVSAPEQKTFADSLVSAVEAKGNFTLSPYSARLCLAMLANGAKGDTQKELLAALQIDDLGAFNAAVKRQMQTYDGYARIMRLETANSIWLNQSWFDGKGAFLPAYQKQMQDFYAAETKEVTNQNSVEQVNAWANEKTKGKIPSILTEDNREFVTALVNAVYFKAAWANEFYENNTKKADFTNADGTTGKVDMMHQTDYFGYYATPGAEALKMDYRQYAVDNEEGDNFESFRDADFSMYLIKADETLDVQNLLDQAEFVYEDRIKAAVPKFKIEYGQPLDDALKALGVKTAYDHAKADLSAMVDPSGLPGGELFLDTVLQKTFIAVDEKGTEAAAVTAAMNGGGSAPPERPPLVREFTADSPFWFAIRDNANGEILFVGRYETAK